MTLTANKTQVDLEVGKEAQLKITEVTTTADGKEKKVDVTKAAAYKVANGKVATVSNGLITAVKVGETTITAKYNKKEVSINVKVTEPVVTLIANKTEINLEPGKEAQLSIKEVITSADGKTKQTDITTLATYKTANNKVAIVSNKGLVTAKGVGNTTITAKYGKNDVTINVTVAAPEVTLTVNKPDISLESGKESQLKITEVTTTPDGKTTERNVTTAATYKVADKTVATVTNGLVKAKNSGSTIITAIYGKNEVTVNVTVTKPEVTLFTDIAQIDLEPGKEAQLTIKEITTTVDGKTTERNVTSSAKYKVADSSVATVTNGLVRAKSTGATTINVSYGENTLTINVNVAAPAVTLIADNTQIELEAGKEVRLAIKEVTTTPDGTTTERDVTTAAKYTPGDKALITVNGGLVRAKKAGNTTITVKYGKNELTINVNITEASFRSIIPGSETVVPIPESFTPDTEAIPLSA